MKVAIVVDQFPIRSQTFVLNQITGLIDLGIEVDIIALRPGQLSLFEQGDYLSYQLQQRCIYLLPKPASTVKKQSEQSKLSKLVFRLRMLIKALFTAKKAFRTLKSLNPKLGEAARNLTLACIVSEQNQALSYDWLICHFGPVGVLVNKLRKIGVLTGKIATFFHGFDISVKQSVINSLSGYRELFNDTELMLPISQLWQQKLISLGCAKEKVLVHRMGIDLSLFSFSSKNNSPEVGTDNDQSAMVEQSTEQRVLQVFTVARFTEKKGLCYAIESLAKLPAEIQVNYQIGGYGELLADLQALVLRLGLANKVTFCGALNSEQVKDYMQQADVFLQPSITAKNGDMEGVPVAIMEAMALGTPIIATNHSGIPELITHNLHGYLVAERDSQAIADRLVDLHDDLVKRKLKAQIMTIKARERIEANADVKRLNKQLISLLTEYQ